MAPMANDRGRDPLAARGHRVRGADSGHGGIRLTGDEKPVRAGHRRRGWRVLGVLALLAVLVRGLAGAGEPVDQAGAAPEGKPEVRTEVAPEVPPQIPPEIPKEPINLWPFYDQRYDPVDRAVVTSGLGPIIFSSRAVDGSLQQRAVRPFYHWRHDAQLDREETESLYPLMQHTRSEQDTELQILYVFDIRREGSKPEEREEHSDLFPFYMSGRTETGQRYRWFFPFYGTVYDRLGREEISIVLFPLYLRTRYHGWENVYAPWPFMKWMSGEDGRTGFHLWPLYGEETVPGKSEWHFFLWPFFMSKKSDLDTDNPEESVVALPFVMSIRSPARDTTTYLWPLFTHKVDRERKFEEWDFPWPLFIITRGEGRYVTRFLPFFTVERYNLKDLLLVKEMQVTNLAILYPLYIRTIDETATSRAVRDRVLWWLYSDIRETGPDGDARRVDMWPFFRYVRDREGWVTFQAIAPLEAFMPGNELFERNWSPLWALYTYRRNPQGDRVTSVLWNLVRYEATQEGWALEVLGPLLAYREQGEDSRLSLLAGALSFEHTGGVHSIHLFRETVLAWRDAPQALAALDPKGGVR